MVDIMRLIIEGDSITSQAETMKINMTGLDTSMIQMN